MFENSSEKQNKSQKKGWDVAQVVESSITNTVRKKKKKTLIHFTTSANF
jgi:hypothetical protein